jgi:methyl-accepting chemotaxis protein
VACTTRHIHRSRLKLLERFGMKNSQSTRTIGFWFTILACLGLLVSVAGITATWLIRPRLSESILRIIDSLEETLLISRDGLQIMNGTIEDAVENLTIIETTLENLESTIDNITGSLESSAALIGDELPMTMIDTQIALSSAATSAKLIDDTLSIIAMVPFIGANYQPDVPLSTSLTQVSVSLSEIPDALKTIETDLMDTSEGISAMNQDLSELSGNMSNFEKDLEDAQRVLMDYDTLFTEILDQTNTIHKNLPKSLFLLSLFITGILFSISIIQTLFLLQGLFYLKGDPVSITHTDNLQE